MGKLLNFSLTLALFATIQVGATLGSLYDGDQWTEWAEWSPCSRTCDGGVTQQFRRCKSPTGCHGVSIKRKMCNMQPCTEPRDYRGDQCRAYNGRKYEGKKRTWAPIEDPEEPCALICHAEGTDHIVKLNSKLRDGTRCKKGSLHVCVDGVCEMVGCDLKIGSPKKIDACGICGGDSKSCSTPVYRWDLESNGPCTAKCGGGAQPVKIVCRNSLTTEKVDPSSCNSASKPLLDKQSCNIHPCEPQWEFGEWSACSTTCGGGLKIRKVYCAQEKNGTKIQVADKLCHHIRRPSNQESCNPQPCPHWHAGPWSMCSVTCGKGYMTRNVVCRDSSNLPSSNCDYRLKPGETKECFDASCQLAAATLSTAQVIDIDKSSANARRGKTTTENNLDSFSSSSAQEIPAEYQLPNVDNDVYVEEELPREHTLPLIQPYPPMDNAMLFDSNALPSEPTFVAGEWSSCSATCGEGQRTREVKCKIFLEFSRTIANLPDKECPGPKPIESEPCFNNPCHLGDGRIEKLSDANQAALADSDSGTMRKSLSVGLPPGISLQDMTFSWKVLGYTPCSASCLGGIQEAMIQCVRDYDQRIATPVLCMDKPQPDIATTRTCNDHPCPVRWNVTEFGPCSKSCGGGVMTREVSCIHEVTRGNTVIVPNNICPSAIPRTEMLCNTVNCSPYWEAGEWGKCSKPCGGGLRSRAIHCKQISALGQVVELSNGDLHCTSSKPEDTKACNKKSCSKMGRPGNSDSDEPEFKDKVTINVKGRRTVYSGVQLRLRCPIAKNSEIGALIWRKDHNYLRIQPERMELIHKSGMLKIKNTTFSDSGIYTCIANGRPVSNVTLLIKPFAGPRDKRPRGRNSHDSTLYADQQEGGVSVPMFHEQIITPNSKFYESVSTSSASSLSQWPFLSNFFFSTFCLWFQWPNRNRQNDDKYAPEERVLTQGLAENFLPSANDAIHFLDDVLEVRSESGPHRESVRNSSFPFRATPTINEQVEDELSKVEKLLLSKGLMSLRQKDPNHKGVHWVVGEWTECLDSECFNGNTGLKRRQVSCEFWNGSTVPFFRMDNDEPQCDPGEKPLEVVECYNSKCLGRWYTHSWSFCKVPTCESSGFRTRVLQCLWYGSGRPAGQACHSLPRPNVTKPCKGPPCSRIKAKTNTKLFRTRHYHSRMNKTSIKVPHRSTAEANEPMDYWGVYDEDQ